MTGAVSKAMWLKSSLHTRMLRAHPAASTSSSNSKMLMGVSKILPQKHIPMLQHPCDSATAPQALQGAGTPQCQLGFPPQVLHSTTAPSTQPFLLEFPLQGCGFESCCCCILKHKLINFSLMRTLLAGDYHYSAQGDTNKHSQALQRVKGSY